MWTEIAEAIKAGNPYIWTILVFLLVGLSIIFEKYISIVFRYSINSRKFNLNLKKMITSEDYSRAISLCRSYGEIPVPKMALQALEAHDLDPFSTKGAIDESVIELLPRIESRINFLPSLAAVTLLIGTIGTIEGIWTTFHTIDVLDSLGKQVTLTKGLSGSLNPSAMGLIAATIIMAGHSIARSLALSVIAGVHHTASVLHNLLVPRDHVLLSSHVGEDPKPSSSSTIEESGTEDSASAVKNPPTEDANNAPVEDIKDEEEII